METQLQIKINSEEKRLIERAGDYLGMGHSTFARMVCLQKAREVLRENSGGETC